MTGSSVNTSGKFGELLLLAYDGVLVGIGWSVSLDPALDLRRLLPPLITRLIRPAVVFDPLDPSESDPEEVSSSELEESIQAATGPGADSSSMMCCGVLSYIYAWDFSWKSRYMP